MNILEDKNKKNKSSLISTGIKGAAIGAGATIIATQIMKDEKRVKKVKKILSGVKEEAMNRLNLPNSLEEGISKGAKKLSKEKKVKKIAKKVTTSNSSKS